MNVLYALAALAIVVLVIGQQLRGQRVRASRVIGLPVALTIIGVVALRHQGFHPTTVDWAFLAGDVMLAVGIGLFQGSLIRLQPRPGGLWLSMPRAGLWLWIGLVVTRIALMLIAHGAGAAVAASGSTLLLMLGVNRMAQGIVVGRRVLALQRAGEQVLP
jgi:hypothetical protein